MMVIREKNGCRSRIHVAGFKSAEVQIAADIMMFIEGIRPPRMANKHCGAVVVNTRERKTNSGA